ncbi:DMT family transporter [Sphingomonas sp. Y38-1Y]|uniref:DMT family transporter n=1 Tax=Sphingomonas sp. Y38-1Y TaxID=3078265 RepID=UPI0028E2361B|nr:DMT family transporter [Sphingomonas sp. Y38-1Y]
MNRAVSPALAFAAAVAGIAVFSGMDAIMKGLVLGIGAYTALFWRNVVGVVLSGVPYFARPRPPLSRAGIRLHLARGVITTVMSWLFFWGLARVPMAQAIALSHIAPLLSLFLAAWLLGETIGRRTILASLIAFAGVLVILAGQANAEMGPDAFRGAVAVLASALCYAVNIILMRRQSQLTGPGEIAFFQSLIVAAVYAIGAPWLADWPEGRWVEIVGAACLAVVSLALLGWAYAHAPASVLAPSEYTAFIWASILGFIVFGESLSVWTLAGAVLIIGGCLWAVTGRRAVPMAEAALP